jgi:transcription factor WhiB
VTAVLPAWAKNPPGVVGGERLRLAPGVWLVRTKQWWPVAVLDTEITGPELDVEIPRRAFPHPAWHAQARCKNVPGSEALFFGVEDEHHPPLAPTAIEAARALCFSCPVAEACLSWALGERHSQADGFVATGEEFGIWGGTTGRQRAKLQKRRKLGESVRELVSECLPR